jgi:hypothetical protein
MQDKPEANHGTGLPPCATEFIRRVVRRMWYRRRAKRDVQAELTAHFEDAVRDCATTEEKERRARELIEEFGDARLLAVLCHRAKKRCRPLWLKALLWSGQGLGLVLLYCVLCALPPMLGRPTIRVNYLEWLSNHWRPKEQSVENAKVSYDQAAALYVPPPPGLEEKMRLRRWSSVGYSDADVRSIEQWLAQNQAALDLLRRGANTPQYWPTYDGNEAVPLQVSIVPADLETLKDYRQVTLAFKQQIIWEARRGEVASALDDCLVLRRLGRHLQNRGALNGQMGGISIEALGYDGIIVLLANAKVPPGVLEHVQKELASGFDLRRQVVDLECEKAIWYDQVQRTFTDDGRGGGHALSEGFVFAPGDWKANLLNTLRFRYPDRREMVAMVDRFFQQAQRRLNAPPDTPEYAESNAGAQEATQNLFLALLAPAYERLVLQGWRLKTHEIGVITLLALQRYFREKGSYPDNLGQLVEQGYLKEPPKDPFGPGPLTYRKTDTGFLLYSWGADRRDDGGHLGTDSHGQPRMWADNGDWVFWPAPEP